MRGRRGRDGGRRSRTSPSAPACRRGRSRTRSTAGPASRTRPVTRILAIAKELGWYPNRAARALSASRADACGLVLARPAKTIALEPFFMEFIAGVEARLSPRSIGLTIQLVDSSRTRSPSTGAGSASTGSTACSSSTCATTIRASRRSSSMGLPAVVIGGPLAGRALPAVWHDEASVVIEAVRYLAALGHRRIARVAGVADFVHTAGAHEGVPRYDARARPGRRGRLHRLHARERCPRDPTAALVPRAADGDHLRQRPPRRHRARRCAADGIHGPRRPLADRVGRLADQPCRASAAHGDHP